VIVEDSGAAFNSIAVEDIVLNLEAINDVVKMERAMLFFQD
jgi:hypothetical protein